MADQLGNYDERRNFERTPEPRGTRSPHRKTAKRQFVVQQHDARRLHYDFRLEYDGVLKSWSVPKGPSVHPTEKRLAVRTEDHPLEYAGFEGVIPQGEYGGGTVLVWDRGDWVPDGDAGQGFEKGKLDFELRGEKLRGHWTLVRMPHKGERRGKDKENWLLIKRRDHAAGGAELTQARPESVLTGRTLDAVAASNDRVWDPHSGETEPAPVAEVGRPSTIPGAKQGRMPEGLTPQLATLTDSIPEATGWFHEPKLDGYRLILRLEEGQAKLFTRRGNDWTERFTALVHAARSLPCRSAVLDGEVVRFNTRGLSDFQLLQNALRDANGELTLVAFDLLYLDGWDLRRATLRARKELLRLLLDGAPDAIRYGEHIEGHGPVFLEQACKLGLEGVVSKRADAPYESKRSKSWLKLKCHKRQELVVVGYTDPQGSRRGFGALLVGTRETPGEPLRYAGKVGTGFDERTLHTLHEQLAPLQQKNPAVTNAPRGAAGRGVHWVRPELVAEVSFAEWTQDGVLRHPSFLGLREDKLADEVVTERPQRPTGSLAEVRLTHPDKVLFTKPDVTKRQLAAYYEAVAPLAIPLMRDRPLTLYRCPQGHEQACFYQKHLGLGVPETIARVRVKADEKPYAAISDLASLIGLVQIGVLEVHIWGSRIDHLDQPDILVFDLDPSEELPWGRVATAALQLKERLGRLGLVSFVKATGGKGLHVVVPVVPGPTWPAVKQFTESVAREMVQEHPDQFTSVMSKQRRHGKIFIDYLRNAREATAIAAYSPRAKSGAPVALPLSWDELDPDRKEAPRFGLLDVPKLIAQRDNPWQAFEAARKSLMG